MDPSLRLARFLDRRRWPILGVFLLIAAAASVLAERLPLHGDFSYLLPDSTPSVRDLHELEKRVKHLGTITIGVLSSDPAARERAATRLRRRLQAIDPELVSEVLYDDDEARSFVWKNRFLYAGLKDLVAARDALADQIRRAKLKANPLYVNLEDEKEEANAESDAESDLQARLDDAEAKSRKSGFVSKDGHLQLLIVRTSFEAGAASLGVRTVRAVEHAVRAVEREQHVQIGMSGDVVVSVAEHGALLAGMMRAAALTVIIVALGLIFYYRSIRAVGALFLSLGVGTAWTFGFTRLAIGHLNLASAFLSSIVVGNGINFGMVLVARYLEERRAGLQSVGALAAAIRGTATGTSAAALTAAVAYGSLASTNFRGFRHFGVIGGVGMLLCWIAAYTVLPATLAVLERRGLRVPPRPPRLDRLLEALVPRSRRTAGILAALALAGTLLAGFGTWHYLRNPYEQYFDRLRSTSDDIERARLWQNRIEASFGHNLSGGIVIAAPTRNAERIAVARLATADAPLPGVRKLFGIIRSIDDVLPRDQRAKLAILADLRRMIDHEADRLSDADRARALRLRPPENLRPIRDADLPEAMARPFTDIAGHRGVIFFADRSEEYNTWIADDLLAFTARVEAIDLGPGVVAGGANFVFADVVRALERDGPRATIVALAGAVLVIVVLLGASRHALITLMCMTTGTLFMLAAAWLAGLRVNFLDFVALPITIGIGIDYSVNIVARARQGEGGRAALGAIGAAVAACSFTTIVGYGSLLLSPNQGIRSFGHAAILGELTCIASALVLAPALLSLLRRRPDR